jgi:hypothetical protein
MGFYHDVYPSLTSIAIAWAKYQTQATQVVWGTAGAMDASRTSRGVTKAGPFHFAATAVERMAGISARPFFA